MKKKSGFPIHFALGGFVLAVIGCTYGKWEYLSRQYASEFYPAIRQASDDGCLISYAKIIKVIDYKQNSALIWFKEEGGSTHIAKPWRSSKQPNWQFKKTDLGTLGSYSGSYCDLDVIRSRSGGSADGYYWYN
ncbi:hypothetical protein H6F76_14555 [Leptolyngbya sp. FACHB-321]|uniref:hypothetical protein n=1 Tax=Leptolyngbya sp. FACHB-321 TaxID=2692807 RepID=UPI001689A749|nr:hypothetical protein [Leptolyngbya sp. FACHB-321]MBD2036236.1 hypothetical protein [Leptolyngbya sp. FACHB-321]